MSQPGQPPDEPYGIVSDRDDSGVDVGAPAEGPEQVPRMRDMAECLLQDEDEAVHQLVWIRTMAMDIGGIWIPPGRATGRGSIGLVPARTPNSSAGPTAADFTSGGTHARPASAWLI